MEIIVCDWCKEETDNWIIAFDGRKLCGPKEGNDECWKRGTKINHTVKVPR